MALTTARDLRTHWIAELGWLVETPVALSRSQLERIRDWVRDRQKARLFDLPPGDGRDECLRTLEDLKPGSGRFNQRLMETRDGSAAFQSTERVNKGRTFFHGKD